MLCHKLHYNFRAFTSFPARYDAVIFFPLSINFSGKWSVCNCDYNSHLRLHISDCYCSKAQDKKASVPWCLERSALLRLSSWFEYYKKLFICDDPTDCTTRLPVPLGSQQGHTHSSRAACKSAVTAFPIFISSWRCNKLTWTSGVHTAKHVRTTRAARTSLHSLNRNKLLAFNSSTVLQNYRVIHSKLWCNCLYWFRI